jgi:hypothetical protein
MNKQLYFVVGDRKLDAGDGIYVRKLEDIKPKLLRQKIKTKWVLVISIHGSEKFIATRTVAIRGGKGAYDATAVRKIFANDAAFKKWRDTYGPARVVLNACQVGVDLESAIIESLTKKGSGQANQGLGTDCRPSTKVEWYTYNGKRVERIGEYKTLPESAKTDMQKTLKKLNKEWGYFGAPPVPEAEILHYYFAEEPKGGWPVVRVSYRRKDTDVAFYNRMSNGDFHKTCDPVTLRGHKATAPPDPQEE